MNILLLPTNIASMPAITTAALNEIPGIRAKCVVQIKHHYQGINDHVIHLPSWTSKRNPFRWLRHKLSYGKKIRQLIDWADVVHYSWGAAFEDYRDLAWVVDAGKPIYVEWFGSDIRNPEYLMSINPYYAHSFENGYEHREAESAAKSQQLQQAFSKAHAVPVLTPEMSLFLNREYFPYYHSILQRVNIEHFTPRYPDPNKQRPLVVHSPSAKVTKGTDTIVAVMNELAAKYDFDFRMVHNIPREEVLQLMQDADIYIDQVVLGSYGMAATEAMSYGKPVVCYIMPEVFDAGLPGSCPIVNAHPGTLREQLVALLESGTLRYETGRKSRAFAEAHHDVRKIARQLVDIYQSNQPPQNN